MVFAKFFRNRKIKKALSKWKPNQTIEQLVHSMAEGLVSNLEKAGLKPDEIESIVRGNDDLIIKAVNDGMSLLDLCEEIKDTVLSKDKAFGSIEKKAFDPDSKKGKSKIKSQKNNSNSNLNERNQETPEMVQVH